MTATGFGDDMSELAERAARIVAGGASGVVIAAVTGLMAAAGVVTNNSEWIALGVPAGAFPGAATEEGLLAVRRIPAAEGVLDFVDAVERETGEQIEEFWRKPQDGSAVGRVRGHRRRDDRRVDRFGLAKAFVAGATDPAKVDPMLDLVRILPGVEGKHARVMAVLAKPPHGPTVDEVAVADPGLDHTVAILAQDLERLGL